MNMEIFNENFKRTNKSQNFQKRWLQLIQTLSKKDQEHGDDYFVRRNQFHGKSDNSNYKGKKTEKNHSGSETNSSRASPIPAQKFQRKKHLTGGFSRKEFIETNNDSNRTGELCSSLLMGARPPSGRPSQDVVKLISLLQELSNGMMPLYSFWKSGLCMTNDADCVIEGSRYKIETICKGISRCLGNRPKYGKCPENYVEIFSDHGHVLYVNAANTLRNLQFYSVSHNCQSDAACIDKIISDCRRIWGVMLRFFVQFWNTDTKWPCRFWDAWTVADTTTRRQMYEQFCKISSLLIKWLSSAPDEEKKIATALDAIKDYKKVMSGTITLQDTETE